MDWVCLLRMGTWIVWEIFILSVQSNDNKITLKNYKEQLKPLELINIIISCREFFLLPIDIIDGFSQFFLNEY